MRAGRRRGRVFLRAGPRTPLSAPGRPPRPGCSRRRAPARSAQASGALRLAVPAPGRPRAPPSSAAALPRHAPFAGALFPPIPTVWGRLHLGESGESGSEDPALEEVPRIVPPPPRRFPHPSQSCVQGARPLATALRNYASGSPRGPRTCLGEEGMKSRGPGPCPPQLSGHPPQFRRKRCLGE